MPIERTQELPPVVDLKKVSPYEIGRFFAMTPEELGELGLTQEQVRTELDHRQEERLKSYEYFGSEEHLKTIRADLIAGAHAAGPPPWEE